MALFIYNYSNEKIVFSNHYFKRLFPEITQLPYTPEYHSPLHCFVADMRAKVDLDAKRETIALSATINTRAIDFELVRIEEGIETTLIVGQSKNADSNKMLRLLADNLPDMLWAKDIEGRYLFANRAICHNLLMAENTSEPLGKTDVFFALRERGQHPDNPNWHTFGELCFNSDEVTIKHLKPMRFEEYGNVQGKMRYLEVHKAPLYDTHGALIGTVGSGRDITLQKQLETELNKANETMKALLDASIEARFIFDCNGVCIETNAMASELTGYKQDEIVGMHASALMPQTNRADFDRHSDPSVNASNEARLLRKNGAHVEVLVREEAMELFSQSVRVAAMIDISEIKQANRRIEHLAFHDSLTGLPNRVFFMEQLKQKVELADHRDAEHVALLFIDLDDFKYVNDTQGHETGDEVLKIAAKCLESITSAGELVARFGGDEFVVLFSTLGTDEEEAVRVTEKHAEKILGQIAGISATCNCGIGKIQLSCSIGVVLVKNDCLTPSDLLRHADIALYEAKNAGKNTIRFFNTHMQNTVNRQIELQNDINQALAQHAFELVYQAQVDMKGKCIGAEALCRWAHPQKGMLEPSYFIPFAERNGQIHEIGLQVLTAACETLRRWQSIPELQHLTLSVNISAVQFERSALMEEILTLITRYAIAKNSLKLELTESIFLSDIKYVITVLETLSDHGVAIALDDFGTGFSSLSHLKKLPLTQLKIDQNFVQDILTDANDQAIVSATIAIAEKLHFDVIAEGVENKAQQTYLSVMGCRKFQGYLYGKAVPREEFERRLMRGSSVGRVAPPTDDVR